LIFYLAHGLITSMTFMISPFL